MSVTDHSFLSAIYVLFVSVIAIYVIFNVTYCLWLLIVAATARICPRKLTERTAVPTSFCILVPAHDEEQVIRETLSTLVQLTYPADLYSIYVIADNCSDRTAEIASEFPAVHVLQRHNEDEKSKGYALNWAIESLRLLDSIDAFVIVDADTRVEPLFLCEMDTARRACPEGRFAAQGRYDVANPAESRRTALMAGAMSLVHVVRPAARERLGLTVGLKGNGMCFDKSIMCALPWRGEALAEDLDYCLDLLEKFNIRVQFVPTARLAALMPTTNEGAASQRNRWENGRLSSASKRAGVLLWKGIIHGNIVFVDAAIDLLSPALVQLTVMLALWLILLVPLYMLHGSWQVLASLAGYSTFAMILYVFAGFAIGDAPKLAYSALPYALGYAAWKVLLRLKRRHSADTAWVRTPREESPAAKK
jgi:cellulose synthase/poly-beta-1,6-N-acetylglucosamine synthase-like glycosyltransferase